MYFIVTGLDYHYMPMYICHCPKIPMYLLVLYKYIRNEIWFFFLSLFRVNQGGVNRLIFA